MPRITNLNQKLPWSSTTYIGGLFVFVLGCFPNWLSRWYLPYCFKPLSQLLRYIFGKWDPALGEWVYLLLIILLIIRLVRVIRKNMTLLTLTRFWIYQLVTLFNGFVKLYIIFQLCWGFNYLKNSPASDFGLNVPNSYTEAQMDHLSLQLIQVLNQSRANLTNAQVKRLQFDSITPLVLAEFKQVAIAYPFLNYPVPVVKKASFPSWGDYFGYTAFYQPLTGEAIVRADLPLFTQPFTMSHEISHQLGYASEAEANFIAYVIGVESKSPLLNYATALQLFSYAQVAHLNSIAKRGDFNQFENIIARNKKLLDPKVIADRKAIRLFFEQKQDLQIPGSTAFYNQFLQWNQQAKGIETYNDVLLWVLAYENKYHRLH
jgi:hypothetical protein